MKASERADAIRLRREGRRYSDLTRKFGVAKSTLWRWLKAEGLVETQPQRQTELRQLAQQKAVEAIRRKHAQKMATILQAARQEIRPVTVEELRLIGAALYWAEGSKQRESRPSSQVIFSNTDPRMLQVFVEFLIKCCGVEYTSLYFQIYLHQTADADKARHYWSSALGIEAIRTAPVIWKRHNPKTVRKNVRERYHGLLRIVVRGSTDLNRRMAGWATAIHESLGSGAMVAHLALDQKIPGSIPGSPAIVYLDNGESFEVRDEHTEGTRVRVAEYGAMTYT